MYFMSLNITPLRVKSHKNWSSQYSICLPWAATHATHFHLMDVMSLLILAWGMFHHSCCNAIPRYWMFAGAGSRLLTLSFRSPLTFSIGAKSGERDDQSITWTLLANNIQLSLELFSFGFIFIEFNNYYDCSTNVKWKKSAVKNTNLNYSKSEPLRPKSSKMAFFIILTTCFTHKSFYMYILHLNVNLVQ